MTSENKSKSPPTEEKSICISLPRPVIVESSPLSSPYFRKLPPLSPRSMKMIDPNYNAALTEDYKRKSPAELSSRAGSSCSAESTTSSMGSDYLTTSSEAVNVFDFQRKPSGTLESSPNDIDFFLHVVDVYDSYLADQITLLEAQYSENYLQQQNIQKSKKKLEEQAIQRENDLTRDIAKLIAFLHQKQVELKSTLQKHSQNAINNLREKEDQCRKNMKILSDLKFCAKRQRGQSAESLKRDMAQEFKDRLSSAIDLSIPDFNPDTNYPSLIDVPCIKKFLMNVELQPQRKPRELIIHAPRPGNDVSKSHITVRWCPQFSDDKIEIYWKYVVKGKVVDRKSENVTGTLFLINDLPSNCDVIVQIRYMDEVTKWSEPAIFKTLEAPTNFSFDATTAHVKLKLSDDRMMIFYGGDDKSSPKSPSRFSFALNVLGNQAFHSGRHYWEIKVNRDGWACGVAYQGVPRNSWLGSNAQSWILHYNPKVPEYMVRHAGEKCEVNVDLEVERDYLKKIGIFLDVEGGIIRFIDPSQQHILHTYFVDRFEEPICAAANPFYNGGKLTLMSGRDVPKYLTDF